MRLLVSGSRNWDHVASIAHHIDRCAREAARRSEPLTVVHGGAAGADRIASDIVRTRRAAGWQISEEAYAVTREHWNAACRKQCKTGHRKVRDDGSDYCPAVGMYRNEHMARKDINDVIAFVRDGSSGTTGCIRVARKLGLQPLVLDWELRDSPDLATREVTR